MRTTHTPRFRACASRALGQALGKPWRVGARGPDVFDCWGLVWWVFMQGGVTLPDWAYSREDSRPALFHKGVEEAVASGFTPAPDMAPYSIASLGRGGFTSHVAIFAEDMFFHCGEKTGVVGQPLRDIVTLFPSISYWWPKC